ncbi:MAG: DUF2202 domain-containing protein [Ignavibacterium sp.]|nr:DUF2202 domain-containing protein [Ignavibacterium sp.]
MRSIITRKRWIYLYEIRRKTCTCCLSYSWNDLHAKIFLNIPQSEQRHMDAVKALLDKYEIPDPVTDNEIGSFCVC